MKDCTMRVVKEAAERRNEILDAAEELFVTKGYDKTSTNDILDKVKIARGTLYYHFKSKEDILNAMIDRINSTLIARAEAVSKDKSVPVVERIVMTISSLRVNTDIGNEIITLVHKPQNALMHQKMQKSLVEGVLPILTDLVDEGNKEGIFNVKYPKETTEMLILYSTIAFDDDYDESPESSKKRIKAFLLNTEHLLGAQEGSLQKAMMKLF
jgi:AcrR family transcriptional regulator